MSKYIELLNSKKEDNQVRLLSQYDHDEEEVQTKIFDKDFPFYPLEDPHQYLPGYQEGSRQEISSIEKFMDQSGKYCIYCGYCFALCCIKCPCCIYELQTSLAGIVENLGQFDRLLKPGFNTINPCTERVTEVDLKIQFIHTSNNSVITKDNIQLQIAASLGFRIINPIIANYTVGEQLHQAILEIAIAGFRKVAGMRSIDEMIRGRNTIINEVREEIESNIMQGIKIQQIFIQDLIIPPDIERDLSSAARQRRISESELINKKGDVESAKLMKESAKLLDSKAAMQVRYLQMIEKLGENETTLMMEIGIKKKGFKDLIEEKQQQFN